jgi:hypothetical protein
MNAAVSAMHAARFSGPGASRSLWDFYFGFNLMLSVWLVFLAALAWQLGRLPGPARQAVRGIEWSLVACLAALAALTWSHFFLAPAAVTTAAAGCAALGAWRSG